MCWNFRVLQDSSGSTLFVQSVQQELLYQDQGLRAAIFIQLGDQENLEVDEYILSVLRDSTRTMPKTGFEINAIVTLRVEKTPGVLRFASAAWVRSHVNLFNLQAI